MYINLYNWNSRARFDLLVDSGRNYQKLGNFEATGSGCEFIRGTKCTIWVYSNLTQFSSPETLACFRRCIPQCTVSVGIMRLLLKGKRECNFWICSLKFYRKSCERTMERKLFWATMSTRKFLFVQGMLQIIQRGRSGVPSASFTSLCMFNELVGS